MKATEGNHHSSAGSVGQHGVIEQQGWKGAYPTLLFYRWETEAPRWEQIAHARALFSERGSLFCSCVLSGSGLEYVGEKRDGEEGL